MTSAARPAYCRWMRSLALSGICIVAASQAMADPAAASAATTDTPSQNSLPEVTVQARRDAIVPQVRKFVSESLYLQSDEGPARWNSPVCPSVVGLAHDQAEFVLARLSQIARTAGVPLAGEQCATPNLVVFVTAEPVSFLTKWSKRNHERVFGGDDVRSRDIKAFIDTPLAVRVWYNSSLGAASGARQSDEHALPGVFSGGTAASGKGGDFGARAPYFVSPDADSRITRPAARSLTAAFVVVDSTRLKGVKIGQLADYLGMYAFARLKTAAHRGGAPTILGLFEGAPTESPAGLSAWDEAFLEALYHTDPRLVQQRGMMVTRMVSHLVPAATR